MAKFFVLCIVPQNKEDRKHFGFYIKVGKDTTVEHLCCLPQLSNVAIKTNPHSSVRGTLLCGFHPPGMTAM